MLVLAKRNIIIPCEGGVTALHRDVVEDVPEAITKSTYFQGLVRDGKIVIPASSKDNDVQTAAEKPVKTRRAKTDD